VVENYYILHYVSDDLTVLIIMPVQSNKHTYRYIYFISDITSISYQKERQTDKRNSMHKNKTRLTTLWFKKKRANFGGL